MYGKEIETRSAVAELGSGNGSFLTNADHWTEKGAKSSERTNQIKLTVPTDKETI